MKKVLQYMVGLMAVLGTVMTSWGAISTNVAWYHFSLSLPDVTQTNFGTARDYLLVQTQTGRILSTSSRVGRVTGLEIRRSFETGDIVVSTNAPIWRGVFNPPASYGTQSGNRLYDSWSAVPQDGGKVSLDRFETEVICYGVPALNNSSSLSNLTYSVSRRGVLAGPDNTLWTGDDIFITSGAGSTEVDAVVFIGSRLGALVRDQNDIDYLDGEISTNGTSVDFIAKFNSPSGQLHSTHRIQLYPQGKIPASRNGAELFFTPRGGLWSLVNTQGFGPVSMRSSHYVTGPWIHANPANASATEGSSEFIEYLGGDGNNGFVRFDVPLIVASSSLGVSDVPIKSINRVAQVHEGLIMSHSSSDNDQDR